MSAFVLLLEVQGPSGPQLLVVGPSGRLDIVLRALWALRPCDPRNDVVRVRLVSVHMGEHAHKLQVPGGTP